MHGWWLSDADAESRSQMESAVIATDEALDLSKQRSSTATQSDLHDEMFHF